MNFNIIEAAIANKQVCKRSITEVDSTNKVIFNYLRERGIEGNYHLQKKFTGCL